MTSNDPELLYKLSLLPVECPECGKVSDSIKCYTLPEFWLFLLVFLHYETRKHIGCPHCIRKKILLHGFTYNIFTANLLWLFLILPWMLIQLARSFTKGHSLDVAGMLYDKLRHDISNNSAKGEVL